FFGFGIAFEVPIATIILVAIGFTTPAKLAEKRPYIIVGAFIFGMFLTPPDVISQVLLAIPIWILFEAGVIASRIIFKDRLLEAEAENDLDDSDDDDDDDSDSDDVAPEVPDHDPLSEEEMDAELDSIEASDAADTKLDKPD
ncbi:MAG: twin-arginine translocase subunit TatC, partial [Gammaproteobacteria bacterium]